MNSRPNYVPPASASPKMRATLAAAAKRKTVWVNPEGQPFWLNHDRAVAVHAKNGGQIFPPEGGER